MPKYIVNYQNTIIYKIVCKDLNVKDLYIGNTTNFRNRKKMHKALSTHDSNIALYKMIYANGGWDNWSMVEIEKFPCNDGNEARARERYYFELLNSSLNMRYPIRTKKQYKEDNAESIKIQSKEYTEKNKEKIKEYYITNKEKILEQMSNVVVCDCGRKITHSCKARHLRSLVHESEMKKISNI